MILHFLQISTIIQEGIKDMYVQGNDRFYYLTLMNENYQHPKCSKMQLLK